MRVLLDEMVPRKLGRELAGHVVATVPQQGWAGLTNGRLLDAIESRFDVFVTMDKGIRHQQRVAGRSFAVVVLRARGNDIDTLLPLVPALLAAISAVRPGEIVAVEDLDTTNG